MHHPPRILVPTDFSPSAEAALDYAALLTKRLQGSIDALHAWETPDDVPPSLMVTIPNDVPRPFATFARTRAEEALERSAAAVELRHGIPVGRLLEFGPADATILKVLESGGYDLVIVGLHARHGIRTLLGSRAERLIRSAPCPVITLREPDQPGAA